MVDQQARAQMVSTMADFDDLGKSIWRELIARFMADLPLKGS
jgi:phenylacetic acid degradation operon negative regulatory protein